MGDHLRVLDGVKTRDSPYGFGETLERVERAIGARGLTVFARIDHRAGAPAQGLDMPEATALVFGNPRVGTPAMLAQPLAALDLPLRVLVWEQNARTRVSYQDPGFVSRRFGISEEIPAHAEALVDARSVSAARRTSRGAGRKTAGLADAGDLNGQGASAMSVSVESSERTVVPLPAGTWRVDPSHSAVEFQVKHMMIATVKGRFTAFHGTLEAGVDGALEARGTVRVASLDTHDAKRDEHLSSSDFFDAAIHPEITFASTEITPLDAGGLAVTGELTIKGVTRPVELTGTVQGVGLDPWGNERVALELRGALDRRDFGLTWNKALETGGALVADQVRIELDISAVKLAGEAAA